LNKLHNNYSKYTENYFAATYVPRQQFTTTPLLFLPPLLSSSLFSLLLFSLFFSLPSPLCSFFLSSCTASDERRGWGGGVYRRGEGGQVSAGLWSGQCDISDVYTLIKYKSNPKPWFWCI